MRDLPVKTTWKHVERFWAKGDQRCSDCPAFKSGGDSFDEPPWTACLLLEGVVGDSPSDCPGAYEDAYGDAIEAAEREFDRRREEG